MYWPPYNVGEAPPSRTLPSSLVSAGASRTGPNVGAAPPSRTLPLSVVSRSFMVPFLLMAAPAGGLGDDGGGAPAGALRCMTTANS
jgi:hypothetical protein